MTVALGTPPRIPFTIRDSDLVSPVFYEPSLIFLSDLLMVFQLLKPVELDLMVNEVDTLILWGARGVMGRPITFIMYEG